MFTNQSATKRLFTLMLLNIQILLTSQLPHSAYAQIPLKLVFAQADEHEFTSAILPNQGGPKWLVRYRVFKPKGFRPDRTQSVVYFLHGRNSNRYQLDELGIWQQFDAVEKTKGPLNYIIVAPECDNCYWMNAAHKDERWGEVITQELIADVEKNYSVYHEPSGRLLAGISMGGHGSIQLALNYPQVFGAVAAHSPVFRTQEEAKREFFDQFGEGDDYQNRDPFSLIKFKGKNLNLPIWIDIGGSDFAYANTNNFANLLREKGYQGELHIGEDQSGGHATGYWSWHLYSYLNWYQSRLK